MQEGDAWRDVPDGGEGLPSKHQSERKDTNLAGDGSPSLTVQHVHAVVDDDEETVDVGAVTDVVGGANDVADD